ncbi:hypothetical protein ACWGKU_22190 [Kitasatospora sp. NPDC054768]
MGRAPSTLEWLAQPGIPWATREEKRRITVWLADRTGDRSGR